MVGLLHLGWGFYVRQYTLVYRHCGRAGAAEGDWSAEKVQFPDRRLVIAQRWLLHGAVPNLQRNSPYDSVTR